MAKATRVAVTISEFTTIAERIEALSMRIGPELPIDLMFNPKGHEGRERWTVCVLDPNGPGAILGRGMSPSAALDDLESQVAARG